MTPVAVPVPVPYQPGTVFTYKAPGGARREVRVLLNVLRGGVSDPEAVDVVHYQRTTEDGKVTRHSAAFAEWEWTSEDDVHIRDLPFGAEQYLHN